MRKLCLIVVIAVAAMTGGCGTSGYNDPYYYSGYDYYSYGYGYYYY